MTAKVVVWANAKMATNLFIFIYRIFFFFSILNCFS